MSSCCQQRWQERKIYKFFYPGFPVTGLLPASLTVMEKRKGKWRSPARAVGGGVGDDHGPYFSAGKMGKLIAARRGFVSSPARAGIADADAHAHATIDKCAFIHFPVLYGEESVKVKTILRLKSQFFETYCWVVGVLCCLAVRNGAAMNGHQKFAHYSYFQCTKMKTRISTRMGKK